MSAPEHWYHGTPASRAERVARAIQQAKWVEADLSPERFPTLGQLHLNYCRVLASSVLAALAPEMAVVALSSAMARHWSEWMPGKEWADQERAIKVRLVSAATALDYEEKP